MDTPSILGGKLKVAMGATCMLMVAMAMPYPDDSIP